MDPDDLYDDTRNAPPRKNFWAMAQPRRTQPTFVPVVQAPPTGYWPGVGYPQPQAPVVVRQKRILDMPAGEVLALAAQAFAALQPLPAAPNAIGRADDDVPNLITYQSALATHAKRDEQLRTIGALVAKLFA